MEVDRTLDHHNSITHAEGREFVSRPGHIKDHYKNSTDCLPAWHAGIREGLAVQPDCIKGRVVCRTVYGDIYIKFKDLGSVARVGVIPRSWIFNLYFMAFDDEKAIQ